MINNLESTACDIYKKSDQTRFTFIIYRDSLQAFVAFCIIGFNCIFCEKIIIVNLLCYSTINYII